MSAIKRLDDFLIDKVVQPIMDIVQDKEITTASRLGRFILAIALVACTISVMIHIHYLVTNVTLHFSDFPVSSLIIVIFQSLSVMNIWFMRRDIQFNVRPGFLPRERMDQFHLRMAWFASLSLAILFVVLGKIHSFADMTYTLAAFLSWAGLCVASCGNYPGASHRRSSSMARGLPQGV